MECSSAQRLIAQGVVPGPRTAERAALGFHLAGCAVCQAAWQAQQQAMLAALLAVAITPASVTAQSPAIDPQRTRRTSFSSARSARSARIKHSLQVQLPTEFGRWLWYGGLGTLGLLALLLLFAVGSAFISIASIHRNLQTMITTPIPIATPAATMLASAMPLLTVPTSAPSPTSSATPLAVAVVRQAGRAAVPATLPTDIPTRTPPAPGAPVTILLLGSDRRPGERDRSRTDAIIVARIDPRQRRVALLSLPRDLVVPVPGYGQLRINAANTLGMRNGPGGGPELARQTVSQLLDVPIDYYGYIDFSGFIGAIDALGGVSIDVPRDLYDPSFPTLDYGYSSVRFRAGQQTMDGATALNYSRIRHPDSDFARMRRQQAVLVGVLTQLRGRNALETINQIEALTSALRGYLQTSMPEPQLVALAWALRDLPPEAVERYVLDQTMVSFGIGDDRWATVALPGKLEQLTAQFIGQK